MKSAVRLNGVVRLRAAGVLISSAVYLALFAGCWAPLHSYGIPACSMPDEFRTPQRTAGYQMNYSHLTISPPPDYLLGPGDILEISISGLYAQSEINPLKAPVMSNGTIDLPMVGEFSVQSMNLVTAQRAIATAYANGFLKDPRVRLSILQKATESVVVLGEVRQPGVVVLSKYENDVGHALAAAQGLSEDAADIVEVHRRRDMTITASGPAKDRLPAIGLTERLPPTQTNELLPSTGLTDLLAGPVSDTLCHSCLEPSLGVLTIPLRGPDARPVSELEVTLKSGDVLVVPGRRHEVFYVVGRLRATNAVRFTAGNRDRELGIGFILPRDREIDVVTAVAMAGYLDPIDSPTTVTVHRILPDGQPLLIRVDLIAARYDRRETVLVHPGDVIYLNPDVQWWWRYTLDRVMPALITLPYAELFIRGR